MGKDMEGSGVRRMKNAIGVCLQVVAVTALFSLVYPADGGLAVGETAGQWVWFDKTAVLAAVCLLGALSLCPKRDVLSVPEAVSWALVVWGLSRLL